MTPAPTGWICPRCRASNAPTVQRCDCSPPNVGTWPVPDGFGPAIVDIRPGSIHYVQATRDLSQSAFADIAGFGPAGKARKVELELGTAVYLKPGHKNCSCPPGCCHAAACPRAAERPLPR